MKKRLTSLMLAAIMAFSMTACGKENAGAETTAAETAAETTAAAAELEGTLPEIAEQIYQEAGEMEMSLAPTEELNLGDAERLKYVTGLDSAEDIEGAASSDALISAVAYSMVLVRVKDGADVEAVKKEMLEGVDPRKWVCVTAEKTAITSCGNVILLIMAEAGTADKITEAFSKVCEGQNTEPLTRVIEE